MDRRTFLRTGLVATAAFTRFGSAFWRTALASHEPFAPGASPYGPLGSPDANGIRLPEGFTARVVARGGEMVEGASHVWHAAPDGGATFETPDGGWIYVSNAELATNAGGAGALRFDADGTVVDAYPILVGTNRNCAGGPTPWGTWLSCEEVTNGLVWECDPTGSQIAVVRPELGMFSHEAAAVDPVTNQIYLSEDEPDSRLYRFTPAPGQPLGDLLRQGTLEVAQVGSSGAVTWLPVPNPTPVPVAGTPTRWQVPSSTRFDGGEGIWFDEVDRTVYLATKGDHTIWQLDVDSQHIEVLFSSSLTPNSPMNGVDNIAVSAAGELWVCEDHSTSTPLEIILISPQERTVAPFLEVTAEHHFNSELTGVAFDPSGTRMYLSSQRAAVNGITFEVSGPFRTRRP